MEVREQEIKGKESTREGVVRGESNNMRKSGRMKARGVLKSDAMSSMGLQLRISRSTVTINCNLPMRNQLEIYWFSF